MNGVNYPITASCQCIIPATVSTTNVCIRIQHLLVVRGLGAEVAVAEVAYTGQDVEFLVDFWI